MISHKIIPKLLKTTLIILIGIMALSRICAKDQFELLKTWTKYNGQTIIPYYGNSQLISPDGSFYWLSCLCNNWDKIFWDEMLYKVDLKSGNMTYFDGCYDTQRIFNLGAFTFQGNRPSLKDNSFAIMVYDDSLTIVIVNMFSGKAENYYKFPLKSITNQIFIYSAENKEAYLWENGKQTIYKIDLSGNSKFDSLILGEKNICLNVDIKNKIIALFTTNSQQTQYFFELYDFNLNLLKNTFVNIEMYYGIAFQFSENNKYFLKYNRGFGWTDVYIYNVETGKEIKHIEGVRGMTGSGGKLDIYKDRYLNYIDSLSILTNYDIVNDKFRQFKSPYAEDTSNGATFTQIDDNDNFLNANSFIYHGKTNSFNTIDYNIYSPLNGKLGNSLKYSFDSKYFSLLTGGILTVIDVDNGNHVYFNDTTHDDNWQYKINHFDFSTSQNTLFITLEHYSGDTTFRYEYDFNKIPKLRLISKYLLPADYEISINKTDSFLVCSDDKFNIYLCDAISGKIIKQIGNFLGFRDYHFYNDSLLVGAIGNNIATSFAFININTGKLNKIWNSDSLFYQIYGNVNNSFSYKPGSFVGVLSYAADTNSLAYVFENGNEKRFSDNHNLKYKVNSINVVPANDNLAIFAGYNNELYLANLNDPNKLSKIDMPPMSGYSDTVSYYSPAIGWLAISPDSKRAVYTDGQLTYGFDITYPAGVDQAQKIISNDNFFEPVITRENVYITSPNPLLVQSINIYSMQGKLVKSINANNYFLGRSPVYIGDLYRGEYFISINTEHGIYKGYFIKE